MPRPKGGYKTKAGISCPGVTTITGRWKESGGLINWAWRRGIECPDEPLYQTRDEAADIGNRVHELIECHLNGVDVPPEPRGFTDEQVQTATRAFNDFYRWQKKWADWITPVEIPFVSELYGYGGTPDAEAATEDGTALVDWKAAGSIYPETLMQVVAYQILIEECTEVRITGGFHILRLDKKSFGFSHRFVPMDSPLIPVARRQFLRLVEAYRDDKELKDFHA